MVASEHEERIVDQATASQTIHELEAEIRILERLEEQARQVVRSEQDRKWEAPRLLQDPQMHEESGRQRKLIVFTDTDTLRYLATRIRGCSALRRRWSRSMGVTGERNGGRSRRSSGMILLCGSWSRPMQRGG